MAVKNLDSRCQDPKYVFSSMNNLYICADAGELLTGNLTDTVYHCIFDYCEKSDPDLLECPFQAVVTLFRFDVGFDPYPYSSDNSGHSDSINKQENTDIGSPGVSGGSIFSKFMWLMVPAIGICIVLYPDRDSSLDLVIFAIVQVSTQSLPSALMDWQEGKQDTVQRDHRRA